MEYFFKDAPDNFIFGDRYGQRPSPEDIPVNTFSSVSASTSFHPNEEIDITDPIMFSTPSKL